MDDRWSIHKGKPSEVALDPNLGGKGIPGKGNWNHPATYQGSQE